MVNKDKLSFIRDQLENDLDIHKFDPKKHETASSLVKKKTGANFDVHDHECKDDANLNLEY